MINTKCCLVENLRKAVDYLFGQKFTVRLVKVVAVLEAWQSGNAAHC